MIFDFVTNRHKLFNKLFYILRKVVTRFVINYGGAGSGKSVAQHQHELLLQLESTCDFDTLFIRKNASDIYDSCYKLLETLARRYNIYDEFEWVFSNQKRQITNKKTGHRILFKGVDDPEKLKSIQGIKRIIVEEASQLDFKDFLELNRRARGMEGIQIVLLFNPINVNHWIKVKLIDSAAYNKRMTVIKTTYKDNKFLTDADREELEALKDVDYNHYRIYCLGEWGIEDPDKLFAKNYSQAKHFGKSFESLYRPDLDIYLAWDFNIQNTCLAIQSDIDSSTINVLREYHFKGVDIYNLCTIILKDFGHHHIIINGDASGNGRSALTSDNDTAYHILKSSLGLDWSQFRVPSVNPSHQNSRTLTNLVFKFCNVNISSECKQLDTDLISIEIDDKGSMEPYKKKNAERSHWADPLRYFIQAEYSHISKVLEIKKTA